MIKAVFFDIDGTLVPWKSGRIPASVFESVAALRRKGILCFVAKGRSPFEISAGHLIDGLDFDGYLLNNGELGVDADGTVFYRCPVDPDDLARLLDGGGARPFLLDGQREAVCDQPSHAGGGTGAGGHPNAAAEARRPARIVPGAGV